MQQLQDRLRRPWSGRAGCRIEMQLVIVLLLIGAVVVLSAALPYALAPEGEWSWYYVEQQWGPTPIPSFNSIDTKYGWDSTRRFYAAIPPHGNRTGYEGVTIVDRVEKRSCTLGILGAFFGGRFGDGTYSVGSSNQYGWSSSTMLNLSTWEVTAMVRGTCFQWDSCQLIEEPKPESKGICEPDHFYGPYGLEF